MKFTLLILTLFLFGCSIEKRIHRPGFHFKKSSTFQPLKKEKNTARLDFQDTSSITKDSVSVSKPFHGENIATKDQSCMENGGKKRGLKKAENFIPSLKTKERNTDILRQKVAEVSKTQEKKKDVYSKKKQPEEETRALLIMANVLSIMSFVFGLLTIVSVALAFIMSLTLILPLLPALAAFFTGGLSLVLGLPIKQDEYKSGFAVIGLVTSLLFIGFFIAVLTGAIWI